jgi:hypothetical protein
MMQPGNKIVLESFVCDDFISPVIQIKPAVTEDFFPRGIRSSRRQIYRAVLSEWEQLCFKGRRLSVPEEDHIEVPLLL